MTRAFYRGYSESSGKRAGQVRRIHVMREDGTFPGRQGQCGIHGWDVTDSLTHIIDPMQATPPDGLEWCTLCLLRLAEFEGRVNAVAGLLAGATS